MRKRPGDPAAETRRPPDEVEETGHRESGPRERLPAWAPGVLSWLLYLALAALRGWSRPGDVYTFSGLMGLLFLLYFWTVARVLRPRSSDRSRTGAREPGIGFWLAWALLFRLALLPAGLGDWPGWFGETGTSSSVRSPGEAEASFIPDWGEQAWAGLGADLAGEVPFGTHMLYDNDVWRYFWDGHQGISGVDPYRYSPAEVADAWDRDEPLLDGRVIGLLDHEPWQEVHDRVSYARYRTVYPPLAQASFALSQGLRPGSVVAWKLLLIVLDLASCLLLASTLRHLGRPVGWVAIYAWCPLVIGEVAGSAHVDALLVLCLSAAAWLAARQRPTASALAAVAGVLAKLTPLLVLPLFLLRLRPGRWWLPLGFLAVGSWPLWRSWAYFSEAVSAFARDWVFNPGLWLAFETISHGLGFTGRGVADGVARVFTVVAVGGACVTLLVRDRDLLATAEERFDLLLTSVAAVLAVYLVLSPTVMPWYLIWILPLLALLGPSWLLRPWLALCALSTLSYLIYIDGVEQTWWAWPQVVIPGALLWRELRRE